MRKKPDEVSNENSTASAVPPVRASWHTIAVFAQTMDGYKAIGQKECGQLANRVRSKSKNNAAFLGRSSLTELRLCLFVEQRRFNHFGYAPQGADKIFINTLLEAIQ